MTTLTARGVESESVLPFAGLWDLLHPVVDRLDRIPEPQRAALAGALAIGPAPGDRFAICAATLSLLAAIAEDRPVALVVDDAHWIDDSSVEALVFAGRRLDADGLVLLFSVRDDQPSGADRAGFDELRIEPLDRERARALIERSAGAPPADAVAEQLFEATGGNPLALVEISAELTAGQLTGRDPVPEPLPAARRVEDAFLARLTRLSDDVRRALVLAAAAEKSDVSSVEAAARALGIDSRTLEVVEQEGLVVLDGQTVTFQHPLLRSAVYRTAPATLRRAAHAALADVASGEDDGRRAWHLAAAADKGDAEAAATLESAARAARRRGGHAEAAKAFEGVARLRVDPEARARALFEAANDARLAGSSDQALALLGEALGTTRDDLVRARIQHLRGAVEMWRGAPRAACQLLAAEAARAAPLDCSRGARMLTDAAWAAFMAGAVDEGVEHANAASELAAGCGGLTESLARGQLGIGLLLAGRAEEALPLLSESYRAVGEADPRSKLAAVIQPGAHVLFWLEEYARARSLVTDVIDGARARSALASLPYALSVLSELDFRTGNWAAAYGGAGEAVRLARDIQQSSTLAFGLVVLARVEAATGREAECRSHVREALGLAEYGVGAVAAFGGATLGFLALGLGDNDEAIAHLELVASQVRRHGLGDPAVIPWAPDLIEAYVRAGRMDDAASELELFDAQARKSGRAWALAAAARCRGLVAPPGAIEEPFTDALDRHARTTTPFERARTQLCYGERLRRGRQRSRARDWLRQALETFERLGAEPWAERARGELRASGETARRGEAAASQKLTPQELQVALVVARGSTNREAGAALFLSEKTIEAHLGRIYRKLNVRSRTELAARLAGEAREAA